MLEEDIPGQPKETDHSLDRLTIVAALNAEPKSMPITWPDDVSIRKLKQTGFYRIK